MEIDYETGTTNSDKHTIEVIVEKITPAPKKEEEGGLKEIPLDGLLDNPFQPRLNYNDESIIELAMSIKEEGLLQPITYSIDSNGNNYIVFGHRRVRAVRKLNDSTIKAILVSNQTNEELHMKALIENIQRDDMHIIDISLSLASALSNNPKLTPTQLAVNIGKDKTYISKTLKILSLPDDVIQDLIKNKSINDRTVLDTIRRIGDDESCREIYKWFVETRPSRVELNERIKKLTSKEEDKSAEDRITFEDKDDISLIKLPKLSEEQKKKLVTYITKILKT